MLGSVYACRACLQGQSEASVGKSGMQVTDAAAAFISFNSTADKLGRSAANVEDWQIVQAVAGVGDQCCRLSPKLTMTSQQGRSAASGDVNGSPPYSHRYGTISNEIR